MHEFTHLIDLASSRLGARAIAANDEFFAEKENLLKPEPAIWIPDRYTDRGKWVDGWETRRRRTPGHDWCIVQLGLPGVIHSVIVDTSFFRGNYPSHCSIDACGLAEGADPTAETVVWRPIVPQTELTGDAKNALGIDRAGPERRFTHVRLNIFPDGGVARFRVMGEVLPDWSRILADGGEIDLVGTVHGGYVVDVSDRFFGEPHNMLMPWRPANMADGWETKRRRGPGHDWAVVRLGIAGLVRRAEIDTAFFKGNYPDTASIEAAVVPDDGSGNVSADVSSKAIADWQTLLAQTKLDADRRHAIDLSRQITASHVRLSIFPDGGISRFSLFGMPDAQARRRAVLRQLNATDEPALRALLTDFCGAPEWLDRVEAARPYTSPAALLSASEQAAAAVTAAGWREAFGHHPRIGERTSEKPRSEAAQRASAHEQAAVLRASADDLSALADGNRAYEQRFDLPFIVSASGKSVPEMLAALRERLRNDPETELSVAAGEQRKITKLRLEKLLG
ncbi:MAG TPA: allantoicase [Vicinamibacterales bacterium]